MARGEEALPRPKVGERVEIVGVRPGDEHLAKYIGQEGEVVKVDDSGLPFKVKFADGEDWWFRAVDVAPAAQSEARRAFDLARQLEPAEVAARRGSEAAAVAAKGVAATAGGGEGGGGEGGGEGGGGDGGGGEGGGGEGGGGMWWAAAREVARVAATVAARGRWIGRRRRRRWRRAAAAMAAEATVVARAAARAAVARAAVARVAARAAAARAAAARAAAARVVRWRAAAAGSAAAGGGSGDGGGGDGGGGRRRRRYPSRSPRRWRR